MMTRSRTALKKYQPDTNSLLSYDVLHLVMSELELIDDRSLFRASLVCKRWHWICRSLIHRKLNLTLSPGSHEKNKRIFKRLSDDSDLRRLLRVIYVRDWCVSGLFPRSRRHQTCDWTAVCTRIGREGIRETTLEQLTLLCQILPKVTLREFVWSAKPRLPPDLVHALRTCQPDCKVSICLRKDLRYNGYIYPPLDNVNSIGVLHNFENLISLGVVVPPEGRDHLVELQKVVSSCPGLCSLSVHAAGKLQVDDNPCYQTICPWKSPKKADFSRLRELELFNFCTCRDLEDNWHRIFDWSNLSHLKLTCASFITSAIGKDLVGLRSFGLYLAGFGCVGCCLDFDRAEIKQFLLTCRGLSELELTNCTLAADEELFIHLGKSIRILRLHEFESLGPQDRHVLSVDQLKQLGRHCPLIRKLSVDVTLNNVWPYEIFDVIAKYIGFVEHLEMNFDLGYLFENRDSEPTLESCKEVWDYLYSHLQQAQPLSSDGNDARQEGCTHPALIKLDISVGPYMSEDMAYDRFDAVVLAYQRTYQMRMLEGDANQVDSQRMTVTCSELEHARKQCNEDPANRKMWEEEVRSIENKAINGMHIPFVSDDEMERTP